MWLKKGKTPVLTAEEARQLLQSITTDTVIGLRDRALVATMLYSFARVSAVVGMRVQDYYPQGKRSWLRLHEKGANSMRFPATTKPRNTLRLTSKPRKSKTSQRRPCFAQPVDEHRSSQKRD